MKKFKELELKLKKRKIEIVKGRTLTLKGKKNSKKYIWIRKTLFSGFKYKHSTQYKLSNSSFKIFKKRKRIEDYDRRRGWRGPITNKIKRKDWENKILQFKLDPTLKWNFANNFDK